MLCSRPNEQRLSECKKGKDEYMAAKKSNNPYVERPEAPWFVSHADSKSSRFPLLQLLLVAFTQRSVDLPEYGLCKFWRYRIANLFSYVPVRELIIKREGLQTCNFPTGETALATWVVVFITTTASQCFGSLVSAVLASPAECLPARKTFLDVVIRRVAGDVFHSPADRFDGLQPAPWK